MKLFDGLLILFLVVQIFLWFGERQVEGDVQKLEKPDLFFSDLKEIEIIQTDNRLHLKKDRLGWSLSAFGGYPIRERAVESFLARLAGYFPGPIMGQGPEVSKKFRVDSQRPFCRVILKNNQGKTWQLFLAPAIGNSDYLRLEGDPKIYRLEPALSRQLTANPIDWIDPYLYRMQKFPESFSWSFGGNEYRVKYDGRDFRCLNYVLDRQKVIDFIRQMQELVIDAPWGLVEPFGAGRQPPLMVFFDVPDQPIRLHLHYQIQVDTGLEGFRVSKIGDPREAFVKSQQFRDLFQKGLVYFLPDDSLETNILPKGLFKRD